VLYQHICKEDTLYYQIPKAYFFELFSEQYDVGNFFLENGFLFILQWSQIEFIGTEIAKIFQTALSMSE
jgi:hypothetical protein